ncbi:FAD-binding oxidoreductase [Wenxinia saemankumensis]|uniref:FAD/FMN-containing dehydrogenase n=1 Tax=Wenxinia saemankumensis TaxID=1447782 RepID=A0A1M6GW97_9RHOB|nr:FAD-binding oxidoreductase [Wenxinia saemankumensis]SHJ14194.1 FAD/FMN-containing dehydrogenase [Wenxinia saemankumensis]
MPKDATPDFVAALAADIPGLAIRGEPARYHEEPRGRWAGRGPVVAPGSTGEVAALVRACAAAGVGIVPWGGGTGLVGGQIAAEGAVPLIVTLERMAAIRQVWPEENVLVAEAGAILADVQDAAEGAGRLFPLSLASEGSARIGGLLATNAGGTAVLRWGNARALCLGIEAVTPTGEIWHGLTRLRKDNTGYDLRDLLIGAEGTLGIITAAALKLVPRPASEGAALIAVPGPGAALELLALAQARVGEGVSGFELISAAGPAFLRETGFDIAMPMDPMPDWSVLVDLGLGAGQSAAEALEGLFEAAMEAGLAVDGVLATSEAQRAALWHLRESIPLGNRAVGAIASHDVSLPLSEIAGFVAEAPAELARIAEIRINCFGHLGDGNLHYNAFPVPGRRREDYAAVKGDIQRCVHDMVAARGGSISAEHGIGRLKVADLERYGDPAKLSMMRAVKAALDPAGIMNPGAVLRPPQRG